MTSPNHTLNVLKLRVLEKFNLSDPRHPHKNALRISTGLARSALELYPRSHFEHDQILDLLEQVLGQHLPMPPDWTVNTLEPGTLQLTTRSQAWILRLSRQPGQAALTRSQLKTWHFVCTQLGVALPPVKKD